MSLPLSFDQKIDLTQQLINNSDLHVLSGASSLDKNYRNKTIYNLNKPIKKSHKSCSDDGSKDALTFNLIQKAHIFIIGSLNSSSYIKELKFVILDVYIKNNIRNEFQLSFTIDIRSPNVSVEEDITEPLKNVISNISKDIGEVCQLKIVSGYYQIHGLGNTKERVSYHFFGDKQLCEYIVLKTPVRKSKKLISLRCFSSKKSSEEEKPKFNIKEIVVKLSPYSFSRVNYENSLLIYNKIFEIIRSIKEIYSCARKGTKTISRRVGSTSYLDMGSENVGLDIFRKRSGNFRNICFGRDVYVPFKMLSKDYVDRNYLITHCPITFGDCIADFGNGNGLDGGGEFSKYCRLVNKSDYRDGLIETMINIGDYDANLILTAGRNGLKRDVIKYINTEFRIKNVVYISCNRETMAVDIPGFEKFEVYQSWISDEFPGTDYNNTIVWLMRS